jgi:hypothetical protein
MRDVLEYPAHISWACGGCSHSFCNGCINDWIGNSQREGKVRLSVDHVVLCCTYRNVEYCVATRRTPLHRACTGL